MKSEQTYPTHNYNGIWMLAGLVLMLAIPLAIGYVSLPSAPSVTLHADASVTH